MSTPVTPKTVLVIEDDRPISLVIKAHLEGAGYRVLTTGDGAEGLARARAGGVDLITLDVLMHPVNGWKVLQELRGNPATRRIPVIFVSMVDERPGGLEADGYVRKPFRGRDLLDVVGRVLAARAKAVTP
jgi:CheY-like chemotaxis protein